MKSIKKKLENKINKYQSKIDNIKKVIELLDKENNDFVLPDKWCVKINNSNKSVLNDYMLHCKDIYYDFKKHWEVENDDRFTFYFLVPEYRNFHSSTEIEGYTEITLEQFKKYVLNK